MSGRPKVKVYQYNNIGEYMREYETMSEVFNKYFDGKKGDLFHGKEYRELPDGTFVSYYRIGREGLRQQRRIDENKYCFDQATHKPFSIYNLKGEKISSFKSVYHASLLTGMFHTAINGRLTHRKGHHTKDGLIFKWD